MERERLTDREMEAGREEDGDRWIERKRERKRERERERLRGRGHVAVTSASVLNMLKMLGLKMASNSEPPEMKRRSSTFDQKLQRWHPERGHVSNDQHDMV